MTAPRLSRRALLTGTATVAALAGAGLAWWRGQATAPGLDAVDPAALEQLWTLQFETPQGGTLQMAALRGRPLLLNFWAPWCPPCVEELPLLDAFYQASAAKGWQVLGLAVDQRAPVQSFLQRQPLHFTVAMAGLSGLSLSRSLGNQVGGLPFTAVFDQAGALRARKMGRVLPVELDTWAALQ